MAILTLQRNTWLKWTVPYWVYVDGQCVGLMQGKQVNIHMPAGQYRVDVKLRLKLLRWWMSLGGGINVTLTGDDHQQYTITNRERWWNIIFDIDLVAWLATLFIAIPHPWDIVYDVVSYSFFAAWIIHLILRRNNYFALQ